MTLADGTTPVMAGEPLTAAQLTGLEFTPTPGVSGQGSTFTYTVTDRAGNTATGTTALNVGATGARDHGVTLVGPPPADNQWQARTEGASTIERFTLDWDRRIATCPAGQRPESWIPDTECGHDDVRIRFSLTHCEAHTRASAFVRLMAAPT